VGGDRSETIGAGRLRFGWFERTAQRLVERSLSLTVCAVRRIVSQAPGVRRATMTIKLSPELEGIVQRQIGTGRYHSAAEVLRDALSLLEQSPQSEQLRLQHLNHKIDQGLESLDGGSSVDGELFFRGASSQRETSESID
jgi:antitoxin ParD1/3/4